MSASENKLTQIRLQHQIAKLLWIDNGVSTHFDYHVNLTSAHQTVKLNVLTYNEKHNEYMLLHSVKGAGSIACLEEMLEYLKKFHKNEVKYTFTIKWTKKSEGKEHLSYFRANTEEKALEKFFHEKNPADYEYEIEMNALS